MFGVLTRRVATRSATALLGGEGSIATARYFASKSRPPSKGATPTKKPDQPPAPTEATAEAEASPPAPLSTTPQSLSLDFSPLDQADGTERTGARSSKDLPSSAEEERKAMGRLLLGLLAVGLGGNLFYFGREWSEEDKQRLQSEGVPDSRWGRISRRYQDVFDYFSKPAWPELLPPQHPPPHSKPYTLLVSLDDLLVTSTWDRQHGWRTAKRPGVDYFLAYISQFYEVVIFTTQNGYTAQPVLDKLDRYNFYITHRLFREATRSLNGQVVKDLSYLNRDLSKVVLLETDPEHCKTHPENSAILSKWKGDPNDRGLIAIIPFLESLAIYNVADVRPILTAYAGKNIPVEYAKKEAEAKEKHIAEWEERKRTGTSFSGIGGMLGLSAARSTPSIPPTFLESKRKEAQQQYLEEQKYIERNKDYLESLLDQEQKMMAAQQPQNFREVIEAFGGKPKEIDMEEFMKNMPPPPPPLPPTSS